MKKLNKNESGFSPVEILLVVSIVIILGAIGWFVHGRKSKSNAVISGSQNTSSAQSKSKVNDAAELQQTSPTKSSGTSSSSTAPKSTPKPTQTSTPTPTSSPAPTPNTTNCLPPNPSVYATYYVGMTNSQYLQTNSYVNTTKLYAALQFAGLINTVNSNQYVVLAMDDSAWNSFTASQLQWMNASPANMKSVLGWQIITSCITWNGVNPVKDMQVGATRVVNTLNGPVTYTHGTPGKFGNGNIGIWDWFTSNGSVTIAGFVNTSSIP